jgi:2-dehydro-3-deoxyphosphooctonate aldolase (KDO 8-P synthase)
VNVKCADRYVASTLQRLPALWNPAGRGATSDGQREFVPVLAPVTVAVGVVAVLMKTDQDPNAAPCDGCNMAQMDETPALVEGLVPSDRLAKHSRLPS